MTTPNFTTQSPIFQNIQSQFTPAVWAIVLTQINASETLKNQLARYEADSTTLPIIIDAVNGAGSLKTWEGKTYISLGTDWFQDGTPERFVAVLSHEVGHYLNTGNDNAVITWAVNSKDSANIQLACLSREGFAISNNIKIASEIKAGTGITIPVNGQRDGEDLGAMAQAEYNNYIAAGATPREAAMAADIFVARYNGVNAPTTAPQLNYALFCFNDAQRLLQAAPSPVPLDPGTNYAVTLNPDGSTTLLYGVGTRITTSPDNGTYHMVVPNSSANGGTTVYERQADEIGYAVTQVTTNAAGVVTFQSKGYQNTFDADVQHQVTMTLAADGGTGFNIAGTLTGNSGQNQSLKCTVATELVAACEETAGAIGQFGIRKSRNDNLWKVAA